MASHWRGQRRYTVADLFFGFGEKFFHAWASWRADPNRCTRLHWVGWCDNLNEASSLSGALAALLPQQFDPFIQQVLSQWPIDLPGVHRLEFEQGAVTLTLFVGKAVASLGQLRGPVDAAWHADRIMFGDTDINRLLLRSHQNLSIEQLQVNFSLVDGAAAEVKRAIVVGAGLAGLSIAKALAVRGWQVQVFDGGWTDGSCAHQGHVAAALTPQVSRDDNYRARLSRAGALRSLHRWVDAPYDVISRCGAIQLERTNGRIVDLEDLVGELQMPEKWVSYVDRDRARALSGLQLNRGGMYFPAACRVRPDLLLKWLASQPGVDIISTAVARIKYHAGLWAVYGDVSTSAMAQSPKLILANAAAAATLLSQSGIDQSTGRLGGLHSLGGEITMLPANLLNNGPKLIVGGDGYVLPEVNGFCVSGSTYVHAPKQVETTDSGRTANIKRAQDLLGDDASSSCIANISVAGWAGLRAVLPGRLPAIGPVSGESGLWVATAFASRGLTWAALAGDIIGAAFEGEPIPLENDLLAALNPN